MLIIKQLKKYIQMKKLDVVQMEQVHGGDWFGTFMCNVTTSAIGTIYGCLIGVACPPAGIICGIAISAGLSTLIC